MNRILGPSKSLHDPLYARHRHTAGFDRTAREKTATDRREHNRVKGRPKFRIERTIDKNRTIAFECERSSA
jgi:hypothetical protein